MNVIFSPSSVHYMVTIISNIIVNVIDWKYGSPHM